MNLLKKLRANEIYSIERDNYALCPDGMWRHKGFHSYALYSKFCADHVIAELNKKGIKAKIIDNTI
ncbi:hypothetical protein LCGC14_0458850 [marine sediment metagenome]|uniref:Uncharacterized protein n=1 Tax=marine sediment metagenome TaxID=412755 RepID=A0A0F9SYL5_9ZZZZ